ncbi:hypothetical protein BDY21DRAFT_52889 [Lineolata rhizophorae]|uniref:Uncharacterized protein n=1 Tax=Lineolata rhizophorae TaxID=578093 RepID=A0A6A6NY86_9PEZI|nr:hypothetical protein BDY21DRAFT_52889 [Lineolata rhizophorae]
MQAPVWVAWCLQRHTGMQNAACAAPAVASVVSLRVRAGCELRWGRKTKERGTARRRGKRDNKSGFKPERKGSFSSSCPAQMERQRPAASRLSNGEADGVRKLPPRGRWLLLPAGTTTGGAEYGVLSTGYAITSRASLAISRKQKAKEIRGKKRLR